MRAAHLRRDPGLQGRAYLRALDIEMLPVPAGDDDKFDVVSLFEVIEHVTDAVGFPGQVRRACEAGGWLVLSTIARTWMSWFTTNSWPKDILGIVPKGTHDWTKYINEDELRGIPYATRLE